MNKNQFIIVVTPACGQCYIAKKYVLDAVHLQDSVCPYIDIKKPIDRTTRQQHRAGPSLVGQHSRRRHDTRSLRAPQRPASFAAHCYTSQYDYNIINQRRKTVTRYVRIDSIFIYNVVRNTSYSASLFSLALEQSITVLSFIFNLHNYILSV